MSTDASIIKGVLTQDNINFYHEKGFLVAENLIPEEEIQSLKHEAYEIVSGNRGEIDGLQNNDTSLSESEVLIKYAAIHFPHKISPLMKGYAAHKDVANILTGIISPNVKCLQTMLFMKAPGKQGQSWHQDEYYIPTRDKSLTGAWLALEDADEENGCLWIVPGSQKDGYIRRRVDNANTNFADVDLADISPYTEKDFLKVEVKAGSVIFFNGYLLHMSLRNNSENRFRRALVSHYSSAETMLPWDQDGRQEATQDFRDIFMVAGADPYEHKGTQDLSQPFVRPDVLEFNTDSFREKIKSSSK